MKWDKYTIDTTTEAEDFISMMLSENGIEGIEIEDNVPLTKEETGEMFIDFPPELPPDEGKSKFRGRRRPYRDFKGSPHWFRAVKKHGRNRKRRYYLQPDRGYRLD